MGFVKSLEWIAENYRETAEFYDAEVLTVYFETKPEVVERLLPPPLKPAPMPLGFVFVANYPSTSFGVTYLESALLLQAEFNGEEGSYCLAMPVTDDMSQDECVTMGKLDGEVAVITGGASGIGSAAVRLFVKEGSRVVIADIQDDKGEQLAEELGAPVAYVHTDVSQESDVEAAIGHALARFGRLDCLYNNAGLDGVQGQGKRIWITLLKLVRDTLGPSRLASVWL